MQRKKHLNKESLSYSNRSPNNPAAQNGGASCIGDITEEKNCTVADECPFDCIVNGTGYWHNETIIENGCETW